MLRKDVYPYEYMHDWEKLNKTSLPGKKRFIQLPKDGTYYWCRLHARKKFWNKIYVFKVIQLQLKLQIQLILLTDVFKNFQSMCLEIYEIDPACFVTASGLAWKAALEKNKVKLDLLTGTDMLLMVAKR